MSTVPSGRTALLVALVPALVAAATMAAVLGNGFVYDDPMAVELARLPAAELALRRFGLSYLSIHVDRLVWDAWAPGLHATNLVLHATASALAALLALRVSAAPGAALVTGLLFAVHPVHVEAVASIENRKDILAMVFVAIAALFWLRPARPWWTLPAAIGAWLLALLAKDAAAIGLAVMLPLADLLLRPMAERRAAMVRALPLVAVGLLATALAAGALVDRFSPGAIAAATTGHMHGYGESLRTTLASVLTVARLLIVPATLSADYPIHIPASLGDPRPLAGLAILVAWVAGAIGAARHAPVAAWAMAWVLIMYLPVSNLVPLTQFFVAERYLYVPSFGVCLLAALGLDAVRRRAPPAAVAALALLVAAGAVRSMARVPDWRDALSLWESAAGAIPGGSGRIHAELGLAYSRAERSQEAIDHFRRSIALGPEKADTQSNLGLELLKVGQVEASIPHFARAVEIWPENPIFHYNLGTALLRSGRYAAALDELRIASSDEAWRRADPSVGAALAARGLTERDFRASIAQWIAENATKIQPRGR